MTIQPKDMTLIMTNWMDTVYLAVEVFRLKIPSELGTEQKYAPSFIVAISQTKLNSIVEVEVQLSRAKD